MRGSGRLGRPRRLPWRGRALVLGGLVLVMLLAAGLPPAPGRAAPADDRFSEAIVWRGLTEPTALRFAPDGRIFVAEKGGLIKVFDGLTDREPTLFADLRTNVHSYLDRGLLSLAYGADGAGQPALYVLYTYDAPIGGRAPVWGQPGQTFDDCPTPPGGLADGCVVSGRLSRLAAGGATAGPEIVLIEDWCQQYPSHSIGDLQIGPDGALYVSAGDGASFTFPDYGQRGQPVNPCGDPPVPVGGVQAPPFAEGGTLRSQSPLRLLRDRNAPIVWNGTVLRLDPSSGASRADNPLAWTPIERLRPLVAYGLRNPFRMAFRPGTGELWLGDVGWGGWEEINRIADPLASTVANFGWPCYEGFDRQPNFAGIGLNLCQRLYGGEAGPVAQPYYAYRHSDIVVGGDGCRPGISAITGLAFVPAGSAYPADYRGALFFADYGRGCLWALLPGVDGLPDPQRIQPILAGVSSPVDLQIGPDGHLYYVDIRGGTIRRIEIVPGGRAGLTGFYYDTAELSGPSIARLDAAIDFDWGLGAPLPGIGVDTFGVRWTGTVTAPHSEDYTFSIQSDDGVRLWIDDQLIIDRWVNQQLGESSGTIRLTAGQRHRLRLEYYENFGVAVVRLLWSSASTPRQRVPTAALSPD